MHPALSTALDRIAARNGHEVVDLPPLYDAVDPDALTTVLESPAAVTVCFEYAGHRVVIGPEPDEVEVIDENENR